LWLHFTRKARPERDETLQSAVSEQTAAIKVIPQKQLRDGWEISALIRVASALEASKL